MKVLVCGGREYTDQERFNGWMDKYFFISNHDISLDVIISGGAKGVDTFAIQWAERMDIPRAIYKPDYQNNPSFEAPKIRNEVMAKLSPDLVIAFPGGSGTRDMINRAISYGCKVIEVE